MPEEQAVEKNRSKGRAGEFGLMTTPAPSPPGKPPQGGLRKSVLCQL